ncbi:MAG: right-handed parallel beta-helix repeat-containing protein [Phycisphaerae bacterium]|nr:right-handed parallel beta-helix repeat-containing protein [Phycisphaerae bacterium]
MLKRVLFVGSLLIGSPALAGDLTPPVGPVAPSHKTLTQVEPRTPIGADTTPGDANSLFRIAQSGSYYLTGNITGQASFRGIEIASSNVTIDLNGYTMTGVPLSLQGIATDGVRSNITIRNGVLLSWGQGGINLVAGGSSGQHTVTQVRSESNVGFGIAVGDHSILSDCVARNNSDNGFNANSFCIFRSCIARLNSGRGFRTFGNCSFVDCSSNQNSLEGFFVFGDCIFRECVAASNSLDGFETNSGVSLIGCIVVSNGGDGLLLDDRCSVLDSIIRSNVGSGINSGIGGTITRCTIGLNGLHGLTCDSNSQILENTSEANGATGSGAGIHLSGSDNRVEGNNLVGNDWGVQAAGAGNFIARNTASGNTTANWDIAANNKCLVVLGANAGAFSGDSGGTSPGSTNPNANYTY